MVTFRTPDQQPDPSGVDGTTDGGGEGGVDGGGGGDGDYGEGRFRQFGRNAGPWCLISETRTEHQQLPGVGIVPGRIQTKWHVYCMCECSVRFSNEVKTN